MWWDGVGKGRIDYGEPCVLANVQSQAERRTAATGLPINVGRSNRRLPPLSCNISITHCGVMLARSWRRRKSPSSSFETLKKKVLCSVVLVGLLEWYKWWEFQSIYSAVASGMQRNYPMIWIVLKWKCGLHLKTGVTFQCSFSAVSVRCAF